MKRSTTTNLVPHKPQGTETTSHQRHRRPLRRPIRSPAFLSRKRVAAAAGTRGSRSDPTTPLLRWKFDDAGEDVSASGSKPRNAAAQASARRLAARIWQLQLPEAPGRGGVEPVIGHLRRPPNGKAAEDKDPDDPSDRPNNFLFMVEPSMAMPNQAMERATKWDPGFSKASEEASHIYGQVKYLEDQQENAARIVSSLRQELERERIRIAELEDECRSSKKKFEQFLRKLADEKMAWRRREHEKIRAVVEGLKDELSREKKNRQRSEMVNAKLVSELTEARLSAKRCMQDHEKERKARDLMEEVCDELAKEIGEYKDEVEALKRDSSKMREEIEDERRMLQMAEVWREERVQMKLVDAKLTLEDKYVQLSKLQSDLEAFLRIRDGDTPNLAQAKEAELLIEAVDAVRIEDVKEFNYQPPHASEDIFSMFEELQLAEEEQEREMEQRYGYSSPASHASKIHTVSPEVNGVTRKPVLLSMNGDGGENGHHANDDSDWETVSRDQEQESSNSVDGSDPSVNGAYQESNGSISGMDLEEAAENGKACSEISEVCSGSTKLSRRKSSSISRFWSSSGTKSGESFKVVSVDVTNGSLSNARISNGTASPLGDCGEAGGGHSSPSVVGQWSSPDSVNPHITRGMKGCIEWPRGMQKQSLKAKLLEARLESQRIQLRHILKQKS